MRKSVKRLCRENGVRLACAAFVVLFFACSKKEGIPEGILSQDNMVNVLSELYIAEQKVSTLSITRDSSRHIIAAKEGEIFEKLNTTDSTFKRSLNYYIDHPQALEMIYTALVDSLNLREQRLLSSGERK